MGYISGGNKSTAIGILGVFVCKRSEWLRGKSTYFYLSEQREQSMLQA